jgi:hypothetical protein
MLQHCQGQRCQAARHIRSHQGLITAHTQGTIESEISNLGRHLIGVRWDNGLHMYVFPDEIEIDETDEIMDEDWTTRTGASRPA